MATDPDVSMAYTLSEPIDVSETLEQAEPFETEILPVNETRVIAIFQGGILDIQSIDAPLKQTTRLEISVFELPPDTHHDDPDEAACALIEDCLDQLATTADVSAAPAST